MSQGKERSVGRERLYRLLKLLVRVALVAAGIAYVVHDVDVRSVAALFTSFSLSSLLVLMLIGCIQYFFLGWRLTALSGGEIRLRQSIAASLVCVGLNLLLPAKIGELAKIVVLKGNSGSSYDTGLRIVFWERFLDMNMLSILCMALPLMVTSTGMYVLIPVGLTLLLWGGFWVLFRWREPLTGWLDRIPSALIKRVALFIVSALATVPSWIVIARGAVLTIFLWGAMFLLDAVAIVHVAGLDLTVFQLGVVFVVSVVGYSIPASPGAIGIFDAALVLGLGWFGVGKNEGLAVALLLRMVHYLPSLSFTFIYMLVNNMGIKDFRRKIDGKV